MNSSVDRLEIARAQVDEAERDVRAGAVDRGRAALESAVQLAPDWPLAHYRLADAHAKLGHLHAAERCLRTTLQLDPRFPDAAHFLGAVLCQTPGCEDEALRWLEEGAAAAPEFAKAQRDLGVLLLFMGRLDEARERLLRSIEIDPNSFQVLPTIVELTPRGERPAEAMRVNRIVKRLAASEPDLDLPSRIELAFALYRLHEQRGEYDLAFDWLERGNALKRSTVQFDLADQTRKAETIMQAFPKPLIDRLAGKGSPDPRPVFIFGMPRSGTSLVEQILSAHPEVHGFGEVEMMVKIVSGATGPDGAGYPLWCPTMTDADARLVGDTYVAKMTSDLPAGITRFTDKLLDNFAHLGLIASALPNATLIHCSRDPRDVAVSCYGTSFTRAQEWSYSLAEIVGFNRLYRRMMEHWRQVLPPGRIVEVRYEEVVGDLETQARRIVAATGLEWDPACLNFHEADRAVRSASVIQVRKPIYETSIGRWKAYERRLQPMLTALGR